MSEPGVIIDGEFYPLPDAIKLGDGPIIREATGLEPQEWAARAERATEAGDWLAALGMVALAVRRAHPDWDRKQVIRLVEDVDMANLQFVEGDKAGDGSPPAAAAADPSSPTSSAASTTTAEPSPAEAPA